MKRNIKNIMMALPLCGAMLFATTSCSDDFFDISNPNQISSDKFWKGEEDALLALTACYDAMQNGDLFNDYIDGWKFGFLCRETITDNGDHSWGSWMLGTSVAMGTSSPTDECYSKYWNCNYELIKRCNMLIEKLDVMEMSDEKKAAFKAEAIALRALGYCNLVSVFRDVPYLDKPQTLENPKGPRTDKETIAKTVLADLKANIPNIPVKGKADKGRLTQEAAYAIMGRMALFTKHYDEAIEAYQKVIGKYSLYTGDGGTDYTKTFRELFTEANEECDEVILGVHYVGPGKSEGQTFGISWSAPMNAIEASTDLSDAFYCTDGLPIDKSPLFKGKKGKAAFYVDTVYVDPNASKKVVKELIVDKARYENRDPRLKATLFVPGMTWKNNAGEKTYDYAVDEKGNAISSLPARSNVCILKWFLPGNEANEYDAGLDYYVIRYAEVLLSLAEAMNEKGGYSQTDITKYVNEVRQRVGMPTVESVEGSGLSQEQLRQVIRHERRVELAFEDLRLADLYRWGEWKNSIDKMNSEYQLYEITRLAGFYARSYRGPQDSVWPIPQNEIDTNPELKQHKEWGGE